MKTEELACYKCEYNLRGLSDDGRCPECGMAIGETIFRRKMAALNRYAPRLDQCDPASVRQWTEGLFCMIASLGIGMVGEFMARDWRFHARHSTGREVTLGVLVSGWVIGNWGV